MRRHHTLISTIATNIKPIDRPVQRPTTPNPNAKQSV
jgi:hypothetical protein